ncbi:hypothetical protein PR048_017091 [Dryococelus australis]|uniref:Uncharacterized protein n=1 Tax=Dryococelus australis TaxID=614101 RepID=A0ABQ9H8I8_9NEOP|nr:hypothetical protein PR048_017091 [Dryococelus australis]
MRVIEVNTKRCRNEGAGKREIPPRKPAYQWHHLARFPLAKVRESVHNHDCVEIPRCDKLLSDKSLSPEHQASAPCHLLSHPGRRQQFAVADTQPPGATLLDKPRAVPLVPSDPTASAAVAGQHGRRASFKKRRRHTCLNFKNCNNIINTLLNNISPFWGHGGVVVRMLASHLGESVGSLPDFCTWKSYRKRALVGGFSRGSSVPPPPLQSGAAPYSPHFTLISSQDLDVKSRPNLFTPHLLSTLNSYHCQTCVAASKKVTVVVVWVSHCFGASVNPPADDKREQGREGERPSRSYGNRFAQFPNKTLGLPAFHQGDPCSIPGRVTPNPRMWESCRTMPLVGGSPRGPPASQPHPQFRRCSILTSIAIIGSQDLDVKSRPNLFTHSTTELTVRCPYVRPARVFARSDVNSTHSRPPQGQLRSESRLPPDVTWRVHARQFLPAVWRAARRCSAGGRLPGTLRFGEHPRLQEAWWEEIVVYWRRPLNLPHRVVRATRALGPTAGLCFLARQSLRLSLTARDRVKTWVLRHSAGSAVVGRLFPRVPSSAVLCSVQHAARAAVRG